MALLRIANLKKSYNITKTQKQDVLKGIDIEFKSGDLVALLGESGCGKSTLINILGGLDSDYTGSVVIKGDFIRDYSENEMDDYRKKRVGLIFQNYNLIPHMTIKENIKIAMTISSIDEKTCEERTMDLLKLIGLANYKDKLPNQLSGGQKQRVAIARALANNPTIILADEPTGALDPESANVILQILKKIAETGKLVIIVTHSEKVASECSRIIKMEDGIIVSDEQNNKIHIDSKRDKEITPKNIKTKKVFDLAKQNIKQKKSRSLLVSMGLAIGMTAVLLILCLSSGLAKYVNNVYGEKTQSLQMIVTKSSSAIFESEEIENINSISGVSSTISTQKISNISYTFDEDDSQKLGTIQAYYSGKFEPEMLYGEIKTDTSEENYIIINSTLAYQIGDGKMISCLGKTITISSIEFNISGIYDDIFGSSANQNAFVSESSILNILSTSTISCNMIYLTAKNTSYVSAIKQDLSALGFSTYQEESQSESVLEYIDMGTNILTAVGGLSMIVSSIMIFIVLYISVSERMKEIGILRAIGARKKDIKKMFMFEAGMIGLVAGVIAVAGCFAISLATNIVCSVTLKYSLISYHIGYYLLGIFASVVVSVLAGISPAIKASDLDPVESLRAE